MERELVKAEQNILAAKSEITVEDRLEIIDEYVRKKISYTSFRYADYANRRNNSIRRRFD